MKKEGWLSFVGYLFYERQFEFYAQVNSEFLSLIWVNSLQQ